MLKEFREFALRGNVIDLAIGIIIGAAFNSVVKSLVDNIIMPPIGLLLGGLDFSNLFILLKEGSPPPPYASLTNAQEAGAVALSYGVFVNTVIVFLITAWAVFLIVRAVNEMRRADQVEEEAPVEPVEKECPYCFFSIPIKSTRCAYCTSELPAS
jgi:large conductance mechanosensitive channel